MTAKSVDAYDKEAGVKMASGKILRRGLEAKGAIGRERQEPKSEIVGVCQ